MTALSDRLRDRFYDPEAHPYRVFERHVESLVSPATACLLDAGCGRTVPVLRKYLGQVKRLIGVELVDFTDVPAGIEAYNADLGKLPLDDACVDLIMSRSVFEHLQDPQAVYREFARVLRPGGRAVFLTANLWDYGTTVARLVPNRFHARVVKVVEGRNEEDTFPTAYRSNTLAEVERLAADAKLRVASFSYLNQYPNYFMFNGALFMLGVAYERLTSRINALRFLRGWILVTLEKPPAASVRGR
jgi:SAM-dependent methyltransferase